LVPVCGIPLYNPVNYKLIFFKPGNFTSRYSKLRGLSTVTFVLLRAHQWLRCYITLHCYIVTLCYIMLH